jgi:hypothetical protein
MIYLSSPYSSPDAAVRQSRVALVRRVMAELMAQGHITICPLAMNHDAMELLGFDRGPRTDYWRELEVRLADACDELVVIDAPGRAQSKGVAREIELFKARNKPVRLLPIPSHSCGSSTAASLHGSEEEHM